MEAVHYEKLLEKGLEVLPDQQRIIFLLSKKEGLTHQKIAEKLKISPLTVRNHLHRALKTIRANHPDVELILFLCFLMVWCLHLSDINSYTTIRLYGSFSYGLIFYSCHLSPFLVEIMKG